MASHHQPHLASNTLTAWSPSSFLTAKQMDCSEEAWRDDGMRMRG